MRCAGREATVRLKRKGCAHLSRFHIDDASLAARLGELQQQTPDDQAVFWPLDRFQAAACSLPSADPLVWTLPPILTSYATPSAPSCSPTAPTYARFNASPGTAASRPLNGTSTRCATRTPPSRHGCAESSAASTRPPVTPTPQRRVERRRCHRRVELASGARNTLRLSCATSCSVRSRTPAPSSAATNPATTPPALRRPRSLRHRRLPHDADRNAAACAPAAGTQTSGQSLS
jgi:hypothetical protein